ncbi:DUF4595 domain-containing protein [Spirosoma aerolatum]|uniref:DUF4595 domain-containing protein n=1 Tax=Spirosoma aerolatum TaxID=1211326 RepID=UPI001475C282|nr:DUF4595 domain-containing protein [Spirosoma aerolatum]
MNRLCIYPTSTEFLSIFKQALNYTSNQVEIIYTSSTGVTDSNPISTLILDDNKYITKVSYKDASGNSQSASLQYNSSGYLISKSSSEYQVKVTYQYANGADNPTSYTIVSYSDGVRGVVTNEYNLDQKNTMPFNFPPYDLVEPKGGITPVYYGIQVGDLLPGMSGKAPTNLIKKSTVYLALAPTIAVKTSQYNYKYDSDGKVNHIRIDDVYGSTTFSRAVSLGYTCQ